MDNELTKQAENTCKTKYGPLRWKIKKQHSRYDVKQFNIAIYYMAGSASGQDESNLPL